MPKLLSEIPLEMAGVIFEKISNVIGVSPTHIIPEGFINMEKVRISLLAGSGFYDSFYRALQYGFFNYCIKKVEGKIFHYYLYCCSAEEQRFL